MSVMRATWRNGQVVLDSPVEWPEGRRLVVAEEPPAEIPFLTEADQRDDPESVQQWIDDLRAIPPLPMAPEQEAEMLAWRQRVKEFNREAVRRRNYNSVTACDRIGRRESTSADDRDPVGAEPRQTKGTDT